MEKGGKMCEMQKLRALVEQILTAAAEEIFGVFKRSITEFEEKLNDSPKHNERNQRLADTVHQTDILTPPEQQGRSSHVDQEDPEPPHIKEDQEEEWISQEEEQTMKLVLLPECPALIQKLWTVKEDGEEDKAQSLELHQRQTEENTEEPEDQDGDDYGKSEPDNIQNNDFPISDVACKTTQHQRTEDDQTCKSLSVCLTQISVHTKKKPFSCSVCKKGFVYESKLKRHMPVHTKEKPFCCSVCKKVFARKSEVKQHMPVHTGERPFCCSICKKCFTHKGNLKEHMSVHTGEKSFCCSVCKKCFARKSNLKDHMSVHTGEKRFSCSVCKKCFAQKSNLKEHMSVHTGEKPFCCLICKKGFAYKQNLKRHVNSHKKYRSDTDKM